MNRTEAVKAAMAYIRNEDELCYDVAANCGQMFGNVRHMGWFLNAVADAIQEGN